MKEKIELVATDLDGTLLRNDKSISSEDLEMLKHLGEQKIVRVLATGRNFRKVREVIHENVPVDYVAFSSGAGIYDFQNRELIYYQNIENNNANVIIRHLLQHDLNFYLFRAIPENHKCWYHKGNKKCEEFERYFIIHRDYTELLPETGKIEIDACQFLIIFENETEFKEFELELKKEIRDIKIVRASSPLDTGYVWMEIFHSSVSKGNAVKYICDQKNIKVENTLSIGNDYNDTDLLDLTPFSYLTGNGPLDLKLKYREAPSNENNAFSVSIKNHLL